MLINDTVEYNEQARAQIPLGRFGHPDEIAALVEAMAGDAGSFMVGQIVSPNGGTAI
jgi:NAD(P)-dependent dehydrogenase (short-subunit alcohol dehydrogenase family)